MKTTKTLRKCRECESYKKLENYACSCILESKYRPKSKQIQPKSTEIKPNPKSQPHKSQRASQAKPSQPSQPWPESPEAGSSSARLGSAPPLLHLRPRTHRPGPPVAPIGRGPCRGSPVGKEKCYKTMTSQNKSRNS